nr:MAG TPA: hypothetical protein [Crassvirales sp.]
MSYSKWCISSILFCSSSPYTNRICIITTFSCNACYYLKIISCITCLITYS